jgi:hypothetical protein
VELPVTVTFSLVVGFGLNAFSCTFGASTGVGVGVGVPATPVGVGEAVRLEQSQFDRLLQALLRHWNVEQTKPFTQLPSVKQ